MNTPSIRKHPRYKQSRTNIVQNIRKNAANYNNRFSHRQTLAKQMQYFNQNNNEISKYNYFSNLPKIF